MLGITNDKTDSSKDDVAVAHEEVGSQEAYKQELKRGEDLLSDFRFPTRFAIRPEVRYRFTEDANQRHKETFAGNILKHYWRPEKSKEDNDDITEKINNLTASNYASVVVESSRVPKEEKEYEYFQNKDFTITRNSPKTIKEEERSSEFKEKDEEEDRSRKQFENKIRVLRHGSFEEILAFTDHSKSLERMASLESIRGLREKAPVYVGRSLKEGSRARLDRATIDHIVADSTKTTKTPTTIQSTTSNITSVGMKEAVVDSGRILTAGSWTIIKEDGTWKVVDDQSESSDKVSAGPSINTPPPKTTTTTTKTTQTTTVKTTTIPSTYHLPPLPAHLPWLVSRPYARTHPRSGARPLAWTAPRPPSLEDQLRVRRPGPSSAPHPALLPGYVALLRPQHPVLYPVYRGF